MTPNDWGEKPAYQPESFETAKPVAITHTPEFELITDPESYIIACCLLDDGASFDLAMEAGLTPRDFKDRRHQVIYGVLKELEDAQAPLALDTLVPQLNGRLEDAGGIQFLMGLSDPLKIGTTSRARFHIMAMEREIRKSREIQRLKEQLQKVESEGVTGDGSIEPKETRTLRLLKSRRVTATNKPAEPVTRLFLAGKPIATPGNIQTLIAKAKQGKTAATGGAVAAIIAAHHDRSDVDTLGFTAPHTKEAVVLIDTEQSPYDTWACQQRILSRAGEQKDPDWLCHYALVGMSVADKKEVFLAGLKEAKSIHGGVFLVILDGVAHFVKSVNDEIECNEASVWLRALSIEYDCPIMCIIHSNEGVKSGDDGRGHLGKQLTRDAESNLLLKKDGDITTITSEKQRKAPITEQDGIAFRWSDELGRHVSCASETTDTKRTGRKPIHSFSKFIEFFPRHSDKHVPLPVLWNKCRSIADIPRNTFRDLCEREYGCGELDRVIDQNLGPCYRLMPVPQKS